MDNVVKELTEEVVKHIIQAESSSFTFHELFSNFANKHQVKIAEEVANTIKGNVRKIIGIREGLAE